MVPENDFSKLNLNGFNSMNFNNFQSVNAFSVTELPQGPDPLELLAESQLHLPAPTTSLDSASDMDVLLARLDGAARNLKYSGNPV